jgi:hypothetical protein
MDKCLRAPAFTPIGGVNDSSQRAEPDENLRHGPAAFRRHNLSWREKVKAFEQAAGFVEHRLELPAR